MGRSVKFVWKRDPVHLIGHVEGLVKGKTLELSRRIFDGVGSRTPVLSGNARANWHASVGIPSYTYTNYKINGRTMAAAPVFGISTVPLYAKVFINNATPYILPLEYGWSAQAPAGMVRVTLAEFGIGLRVRG